MEVQLKNGGPGQKWRSSQKMEVQLKNGGPARNGGPAIKNKNS